MIEWTKLYPNLHKSENFSIFKNNIVKFIRPIPNNFLTAAILKLVSAIFYHIFLSTKW